MKAIIYRPTKSAMQSGLYGSKKWLLKSQDQKKYIESFMGWTGSQNMEQEVCLTFDTKEQAINFAESQSWPYETLEYKPKKITPKSYIDNFK